MARKIDIDDEVYAWLEAHVKGFEQPNDVLRRELLGSQPTTATPSTPAVKGGLWNLLQAGLVEAGDGIHHTQKRKGSNRHEGTIEADGFIRTKNGRYKNSSPALGELVGTQISGPSFWIHDRTGKSLKQLEQSL